MISLQSAGRSGPNAADIKLHIGCANIRREGYINIDCRKTDATDLVAPAWDIAGVTCASVFSIYSRHMLEHLDPGDARKSLRHWFQLLIPGGMINVVVPDIEFHAKQLLGLKTSHFPDQIQHAFAAFWGWRDEARGGSKMHTAGVIPRAHFRMNSKTLVSSLSTD